MGLSPLAPYRLGRLVLADEALVSDGIGSRPGLSSNAFIDACLVYRLMLRSVEQKNPQVPLKRRVEHDVKSL